MLSHGAIIAREFGIPSVVGVKDATRASRTAPRHGGRRPRPRAPWRSRMCIGAYFARALPAGTCSAAAVLIADRRRTDRSVQRRSRTPVALLLLLAQFRLWDDLADRDRDARHSSDARPGPRRRRADRRIRRPAELLWRGDTASASRPRASAAFSLALAGFAVYSSRCAAAARSGGTSICSCSRSMLVRRWIVA